MDQLTEIKRRLVPNHGLDGLSTEDTRWLVAEVDRLTALLSEAEQMVWEEDNFDDHFPLSERIGAVTTEYQRRLERANAELGRLKRIEQAARQYRQAESAERPLEYQYHVMWLPSPELQAADLRLAEVRTALDAALAEPAKAER